MRNAICAAAVVLVTVQSFCPGWCAFGAEALLTNGDFQKWTGGVPDGWEVTIGARNGGDQPTSEVAWIKGPALMLRGNTATMAWHAVSQKVLAAPGSRLRLEFESRTRDIQREGRQYNNCYVGVMSVDAAGKMVGQQIADVAGDTADWTQHGLDFAVPDTAASTTVTIFLSKSGILGVRNVAVTGTRAAPATSDDSDPAAGTDTDNLVANGDFSNWNQGRPDDWKVDIGARSGANQPTSQIQQLGDAGVSLQGNASTMAWYSLSQELAVEKGKTYTLAFEAQSESVRREGRQYDNCYVGVMSFNATGERAGEPSIKDLSRIPRWRKLRIEFRVPPNAEKTEVLIFLSKSGSLEVKNVSVKEATPERPFRGSRR